ncbi:MAG: YdcF family protein [Candidatus Rifleibacteriota bacterium]
MKISIKLIMLFLPTFFFLAVPQLNDAIEAAWAIAFICFAITVPAMAYIKRTKATESAAIYFFYGNVLALITLTICIFFPVGGFISQPLLLESSDQDADAVVVLASGATYGDDLNYSGYQRVLHGIKLLKNKRAPKLFISTGFNSINGHREAKCVASLTNLIELPKDNYEILVSERIRTTKTEADYISEILKKQNISKILLVTNGTHIYRAKLVFDNLGLETLPAPCNSSKGLYYSMGHYLRSLNAAIHEWVGLVYYKLKNYY